MSNAERSPADESRQEVGSLVSLSFGQDKSPEVVEDTNVTEVRFIKLPHELHEFLDEQTEIYGVSDDDIVQSALESYKYFLEIVENSGSIVVVDKYGRKYPVDDNRGRLPPVA